MCVRPINYLEKTIRITEEEQDDDVKKGDEEEIQTWDRLSLNH